MTNLSINSCEGRAFPTEELIFYSPIQEFVREHMPEMKNRIILMRYRVCYSSGLTECERSLFQLPSGLYALAVRWYDPDGKINWPESAIFYSEKVTRLYELYYKLRTEVI